MKPLFLICTILLSSSCLAQPSFFRASSVGAVRYSIDTLRWQQMTILKQRYARTDLMAKVGNDAQQNRVALAVINLQNRLDQLYTTLRRGQDIDNFQLAQYELDVIYGERTGFNTSYFERELAGYIAINNQIIGERRAIQQEEGRIRQIALARERAESEEHERIRDSTMWAQDSLRRLDEIKQQKEFEKYCLKTYGRYYGKAIIERRVILGMTQEMCRMAWGEDYIVSTSTSKERVLERWHFRNCAPPRSLVFKNKVLTVINE